MTLARWLLGISAVGAFGGMPIQALAPSPQEPHPWIGGLYRDLQTIETEASRGAFEAAERRARILTDLVAESLTSWRQDLENVRERGLLSDFAVFVRDVPAALSRRDPLRLADALGRCRSILDNIRLAHEEPR